MKEFVFINNFEEKFDDFKKFIGNPENVKSIDVTYNIGKEVTLKEISNISTLISNLLVEDTNINSDKTKSPNKLPYTGKSKIFLIILVLSIFAILLYKKNIKYKKI